MTYTPDLDDDYEAPEAKRRVRIPLDGGHMDVCLRRDASPETVAALTALGQAAVKRMSLRSHEPPRTEPGELEQDPSQPVRRD